MRIRPKLSFLDGQMDNFGELLEGAVAGDRRSGSVTLTNDAPTEELRGKEIEVEFEVLDVKKLKLPELNDEFLEELGGFESRDQLRETVSANLQRQLEYEQQRNGRTRNRGGRQYRDDRFDCLLSYRVAADLPQLTVVVRQRQNAVLCGVSVVLGEEVREYRGLELFERARFTRICSDVVQMPVAIAGRAPVGDDFVVALDQRGVRADFVGDDIVAGTWIVDWDRKLTMRREFQVVRSADGATLLRGRMRFACIELSSGRPRRLPPEFIEGYGPAVLSEGGEP